MARLTRWGNSDGGFRIPKAILEGAGLRVGDEINCRLLDNGSIMLTCRRSRMTAADVDLPQTKPSKPARW